MVKQLEKAVSDYLLWMISNDYSSGTIRKYEVVLNHFQQFIAHRRIEWSDIFTHNMLTAFKTHKPLFHASMAVKGLSRYLYDKKIIPTPIEKPLKQLPDIYEDYLHYYEKTRQVHRSSLVQTRNVLSTFNDYLSKQDIDLSAVKIEQIDDFLAEFNAGFMPATCHHNRSYLRGFLRYLYYYRKIIKRDLASLIVGAPMFAQAQPPKFLRSSAV